MKNIFNGFRLWRRGKRPEPEEYVNEKSISILNDAVFKAMLASDTEDSREALRLLLCACTGREITGVQVLKNELLPDYMDAKSVRLDVNVTFNDGDAADLEMQFSNSYDDIKNRAVYYSAKLMSGQLKKGEPYGKIRRVYQIFFLNFVLFPQSGKLPRRYKYMEEKEHDILTEATEIVFYELPKLKQQVNEYLSGKLSASSLSGEEKWCIYMKYRHEECAEPLIEELIRKEEGIMRAEKTVTKISREYRKFIRQMNIEKNEYERAVLREGILAGLKAEAKAEGLAEGKREIAGNLLAEGSTPEFVHKITGLNLETISGLQNS